MPERHFFWDPVSDSILQERDENGNVVVEYAREPDGTLISENREGVERQYHFDPMGNVLALTDDNQNVTDTFAYNAFGEQTERTGTTPTPYRYHGQQGYFWDEETGDYHVQRRDLAAEIARWLSADPLGGIDWGNLYAYVHNNPVNLLDPSGLQAVSDCADDPCTECKEIIAAWPPDDLVYRPPGGVGRKPFVCKAALKCNKSCDGLAGKTSPPMRVGDGFSIDICVSCQFTKESTKAVVAHELIHFKRFCTAQRGIRTCDECKIQEKKAYEESCKILFPNDAKARARCIKCGVYFGCKDYSTAGKVCVRDESDPCKLSDLGVETN